jgi:hypothetical protein
MFSTGRLYGLTCAVEEAEQLKRRAARFIPAERHHALALNHSQAAVHQSLGDGR